ncbi:MAG: lysylphosphatidylglycerol synthase domain-containing protein [Bacteroidia bacterium]
MNSNPKTKYLLNILKVILLVVSVVFIVYKLTVTYKINKRYMDFASMYQPEYLIYFVLAFVLLFLNWFLEIRKWVLLVGPYEDFTYKQAASAVFCGVALSIITPNQLGDFAGRVLNLTKLNRLKGALLAVVGHSAQVLVTIVLGLFAYWYLVLNDSPFSLYYAILFGVLIVMFVWLYFQIQFLSPLFSKIKFLKKYESSFGVFKEQSFSLLAEILFLSFVRYATYLFQYWFLLKFFQVDISVLTAFSAIIATFFVQSFIPSFLLLELGLRGSGAIWFIGMFTENIPGILLASYSLWMINMMLPAFLGLFLIYRMKT